MITTVFPLELLLTVDAPSNDNVIDFSLLEAWHEWDPLMVTPFEVAVDKEHVLPTVNAES